MRKTLVLLDANEYDYHHFYQLVTDVLSSRITGKNENLKKIRLLCTCYAIITNWSINEKNTKPAIVIGERLLLFIWEWLVKESVVKEAEIISEYISLINQKIEIDKVYFEKVKDSFLVENGLAYTGLMDHTQYALICYEQIGLISTFGLTKLWLADLLSNFPNTASRAAYEFYETQIISNYLCHLILNNSGSLYPKFDEHCIEINLAFILLYNTERYQEAIQWLTRLIHYVYYNLRFYKFLPLFTTDYEKLAEIDSKKDDNIEDPKSSILLTTLIEWCIILKQRKLYQELQEIISQNTPNVNLQLWFPDNETENKFYKDDGMSTGNTKVSIKIPKNSFEYEMEMAEERALFTQDEDLTFMKEGYYFLGALAFRHYRTYVFPNYYRQFLETNFCFNRAEKVAEKEESVPVSNA